MKESFIKSKVKYLIVLLATCILAFSCALFTACDKKTTEDSEYKPSVSHTDYTSSDDLITNKNFNVGALSTKSTSFPKSSISGWSVSSDSGSSSSNATSGVIPTAANDGKAFTDSLSVAFNSLYNNSTFISRAESEYNFKKTDIETEVKNAHSDWSSDEVAKEVKEQVIAKFTENLKNRNPGTHEGAKDQYVYMLNNYSSSTAVSDIGVAMALASSKSVTLEKGSVAKFTVWVNTDKNLSDYTGKSAGYANIRLATTVNGVTQAKYAVKGINTNGEWKQYTIYVQGNEYSNSTLTLSLGLGFGNPKAASSAVDYAYGTCYFDDVDVTVYKAGDEDVPSEITSIDWTSATKYSKVNSSFSGLPYDYRAEANSENKAYYSLAYGNIDGSVNTLAAVDFNAANVTSGYIGGESTGNRFGGTSDKTVTQNDITLTVNKSAYKLDVKNASGNFSVPAGKFTTVRFKLTNNLSKYDTNGIGVYVYDVKGDVVEKKSVFTNTTVSEDATEYAITVKNSTEEDREFYLGFTVGTTTPEKYSAASYYSTGTVTISGMTMTSGTMTTDDVKNEDYDFFAALVSNYSSTNASYSLHAEYNSEPSKSDDTEDYNVKVSLVNESNIETEAVNPLSYYGVTYNHKFVKRPENNETLVSEVNTSNNAGVINTKYLAGYGDKYGNVQAALGDAAKNSDGEYKVQPLMIYNENADSYGFIAKESVTVSASSATKITLKVRVTGNAAAYVYLTDMSEGSSKLNALTLKSGETTKTLMAKITADTVTEYGEDGWVTVTFEIATGATEMKYRLELWNGSRDGESKSQGYVFFNDIETGTFTETTTVDGYRTSGSGALNEAYETVINGNNLLTKANVEAGVKYTRTLTDAEIKFNKTADSDKKISYTEKYIWVDNTNAKGETTFVYAVYNSIDPVYTDPSTDDDADDTTKSGCAAKFDSGTFWLQFSTIALAVILIALILFILIRMIVRKHKKGTKVKSYYNVSSRNKTYNELKNNTSSEENDVNDGEPTEDTLTDEEAEEATDSSEQDETEAMNEVVEDFGDDIFKDASAEPVDGEQQEEAEEAKEASENAETATETTTETSTENKKEEE